MLNHQSAPSQQSPLEKERAGRRGLFSREEFHLLKVVHNKSVGVGPRRYAIESLTVVTPALDPTIADELEEYGWKCLSHMWGKPNEFEPWVHTGVFDSVTHEEIGVKVIPTKPKEIIELLQEFDGYWWIDIFCARTKTPLVIMGDIYQHSQICMAIIDSRTEGFFNGRYEMLSSMVDTWRDHLTGCADLYVETLRSKGDALVIEPEWKTIISDLHHPLIDRMNPDWMKEHSDDDGVRRNFSLLPTADRMLPTDINYMEFFKVNNSDVYNHCSKVIENLDEILENIVDVLQCKWMTRAWTLQELALPMHVRMPTPVSIDDKNEYLAVWGLNFRLTKDILAKTLNVVAKAYTTQMTAISYDGLGLLELTQTPRQILNAYKRFDPVLARIYSDYRKLLDIVLTVGVRYRNDDYGTPAIDDERMQKLYINAFATSKRVATYPIDYVYSVLGLLNIDIPPLDDLGEVWSLFAQAVQDRWPDIEVPSDVDLASAKKMEDVYGNFKFKNKDYLLTDSEMEGLVGKFFPQTTCEHTSVESAYGPY